MTHIPLVPVATSADLGEEARRRLMLLDPLNAADADDELYGPAFRHSFLFTHCPTLLRGAVELTQTELLYNAYYWFSLFVRQRRRKRGFDVGLEQQVFQRLEHADREVAWTVIQEIDLRVADTDISAESGDPGVVNGYLSRDRSSLGPRGC